MQRDYSSGVISAARSVRSTSYSWNLPHKHHNNWTTIGALRRPRVVSSRPRVENLLYTGHCHHVGDLFAGLHGVVMMLSKHIGKELVQSWQTAAILSESS